MQQTREGVIVSAQVSPATRAQLERLAQEADRSLSAEIRRAISAHVAQAETTNEKETP